jgi:hypothetical protein
VRSVCKSWDFPCSMFLHHSMRTCRSTTCLKACLTWMRLPRESMKAAFVWYLARLLFPHCFWKDMFGGGRELQHAPLPMNVPHTHTKTSLNTKVVASWGSARLHPSPLQPPRFRSVTEHIAWRRWCWGLECMPPQQCTADNIQVVTRQLRDMHSRLRQAFCTQPCGCAMRTHSTTLK